MSYFILKYLLVWLMAKKQEQATLLKDSKWEKGAVQQQYRAARHLWVSPAHLWGVSAPPCSEQSLGSSSNQSITELDSVSKPALWCSQVIPSVGVAQPAGSLHVAASAAWDRCFLLVKFLQLPSASGSASWLLLCLLGALQNGLSKLHFWPCFKQAATFFMIVVMGDS